MPDSAAWHGKNEDPYAFTAWLSLCGTCASAGTQGLVITISTACPILAIKHPSEKTISCRNYDLFGRRATGCLTVGPFYPPILSPEVGPFYLADFQNPKIFFAFSHFDSYYYSSEPRKGRAL
jgi:hypothetical protein